MLPWVCSVIDHRRRQNVVRTSVTQSAIASCATFLFLPHFDVICDLLLNRRTATWNLFVKLLFVLKNETGAPYAGFQSACAPTLLGEIFLLLGLFVVTVPFALALLSPKWRGNPRPVATTIVAYDAFKCCCFACWLGNFRPALLANGISGLFLLGVWNR